MQMQLATGNAGDEKRREPLLKRGRMNSGGMLTDNHVPDAACAITLRRT